MAELVLDPLRASALLDCSAAQVTVRLIKRENHVWRIRVGGEAYFLKAPTKDWYSGDPVVAGDVVQHETTGHRVLAGAGLPAADVVAYSITEDNALGWPYLITRQLDGRPMIALLPALSDQSRAAALAAVGEALAGMHALTFEHPGYLMHGAPEPPGQDDWLHWLAKPERFILYWIENIAADRYRLDLPTLDRIAALLESGLPQLRHAYRPLRFVHGDCHANTFFVVAAASGTQLTGVVDLENCSSGAPAFDFVKFFIEMAGRFGSAGRWWEPLFGGYGSEPDLELIRLLMVGHAGINYTCGETPWPGSRCAVLRHLLDASSWSELFDLSLLAPDS